MTFDPIKEAELRASNPLLDRINKMPGETIRLPSLGKFYDKDIIETINDSGEVIVYPMTMTDEMMMKSPDMLVQGSAIEYVIRRCVPAVKSPMDLAVRDIDYLLTQLRRISVGSKLELTYTCGHDHGVDADGNPIVCGEKQEVIIPLDMFLGDSKEIDPLKFQDEYTYITESDNRTVLLKPVSFRDFLKIQHIDGNLTNNPEQFKKYIQDTFMSIVKSVDGHTDRDLIRQWIDILPLKDSKAILKKSQSISQFGLEFKFVAKCRKCKAKTDLSFDINPTSFFIEQLSLGSET